MAEKRVQRRLAAILAADVAGYSRLVGADETGTPTIPQEDTLVRQLSHSARPTEQSCITSSYGMYAIRSYCNVHFGIGRGPDVRNELVGGSLLFNCCSQTLSAFGISLRST
jgi:hypothetical protein